MPSKRNININVNTGLRLVLTLVMCFVNLFFTRAQVSDASVKVLFPFDKAVVSRDYLTNAAALDSLDKMLVLAAASGAALSIVTFSSPEGNYNYNQKLSEKRAASIKDYIASRNSSAAVNVKVVSGAESWADLREKVAADNRLSADSRREILNIIDSDDAPDSKEIMLKANSAYKRLYSSYFRALRYANISLRIENLASTTPHHTTDATTEGTSKGTTSGRVSQSGLPIVYYALSEDFIRPTYMNNTANLAEIHRILSNPANREKQLVIEGTASPEGPVNINNRLGKVRAQNLADWVVGQFPDLEGRIVIRAKGEDWEGLRAGVENSSTLSAQAKDELLAIIDSDNTPEKKETLLKAHSAYGTVEKEIFPYIRYARFAGFELAEPATASETEPVTDTTAVTPVADTITTQPADTTALPQVDTIGAKPGQDSLSTWVPGIIRPETQVAKRKRNMIAALKSNLLYDAVTAVNVEVEIPIADRFSVAWEDVFPWWETGNKFCFQLWEMGGEIRYWFKPWETYGTEKLRGWFVGPYAMSAKYDFQFDKEINYQGEFWSVGATAGYAMPIGKKKRVNLEFSLSMGYFKTHFRHYLPTDSYDKLIHDPAGDGSFYNIFKYPTKAKVSLVVPISYGKKEARHE